MSNSLLKSIVTKAPYVNLTTTDMFLCRVLDTKLSNAFEKYGTFIARHPWWIIVLILTLNILLASHLIGFRFNTDLEQLYTPTDSQADRDRELVQRLFPDRSRSNFYAHSCNDINLHGSVIILSAYNVNVLNISYRDEILEIHKKIKNITVNHNDVTYSYNDLCGMRNGSCVIDGDAILSDMFWKNAHQNKSNFNLIDQWMGGIELHNASIVSAKALKLTYNLRQDSEYKNISKKWEKEFVKMSHSSVQLRTVYAHSDSLNSELNDNTDNDIKFFALSFTIVITYISFVTAGGNCVSQRGWLGRTLIPCTVFSVFGAFGVASGIRIPFVNIIGVMPFLILGIAVNSVLIFMSTLEDAPFGENTEKRIGLTVRTAGVAVTLTFLTDVIVFIGGMFSVFMVVRSFCVYSVIAVVLVYINLMTIFIACMTLHEMRIKENRHCMTCKKVPTVKERKTNGDGCCIRCFCSGSVAVSRNEQDSIFEKVPRLFVPRIVLWKSSQVFVVVVFIVSLGFSVFGTVHFREGFLPQNLLSSDSYFLQYERINQEYFSHSFYVSAVFPNMTSYNTDETFRKVKQFETAINADTNIDRSTQMSWYTDFNDNFKFPDTELKFSNEVRNVFLPNNPRYSNDITFDDHNIINASRIIFRTNNIVNAYNQGQLMKRLRQIATSSVLDVIIYCPHFVLFEQYTALPKDLLVMMCISVCAIFFVTSVFFNQPLSVLIVTISLGAILCGVVGFLYFWDVVFTPIILIHLLVAIGLTVEFSVHFCYAFDSLNGSRFTRVNDAIARAGVPLLNVAVGFIIGICMLLFAKSYVFISLFKIIILVIMFALIYSVLVLPVFLSYCGCQKDSTKSMDSTVTNSPEQSICDDNSEYKLSFGNDNLAFKYSETEIYSVKL